MKPPFFAGIDVGTQGVRVVLIDAAGNCLHSAEESFPITAQSLQEQSPEQWWLAVQQGLHQVTAALPLGLAQEIAAVSVTSTSGTVIPVDEQHRPLHDAIMYSDKRSSGQSLTCREAFQASGVKGFGGFNSSCGLPKMLWFAQVYPHKAEKIHRWLHAADFIIGKLTDRWDVTDYTNVLKSGYDLSRLEWPDYLFSRLGLSRNWLPAVVPSGQPLGCIKSELALRLGWSKQVQVTAGMTDGCASQIASGAAVAGEWNTTIGTTMVLKGLTQAPVQDPLDRLYNHRHPGGLWMPGGASNLGAAWVSSQYGTRLEQWEAAAAKEIPTGHFSYPLQGRGERFPFVSAEAEAFQPDGLEGAALFASQLEGVAYVERYAFELVEKLGGGKVKAVYTAGGASNSATWLQIRSNVLDVPIYKMKWVSGAVGAAILAASQTHFSTLETACRRLTQLDREVLPQQKLSQRYEDLYQGYVRHLANKGYLQNEINA